MNEQLVLEKARYIFTSGRLIHDRVDRVIMGHLLASGKCRAFGDLTLTQLHAILEIEKKGPLTMSCLAELLGVSPPSASVMVDRLVEKGVLVREHSTEDRRKVVVMMAPETRQHFQEIERVLLTFFVNLVEKLGPEITLQWCEVLSKIKAELERESIPAGARKSTVESRP